MSHADSPWLRIQLLCLTLGVFLLPGSALGQSVFTHVHMRVSDTTEAAVWHQALLGGEVISHGPGQAVRYGNGMVMTMPADGETLPSQGGVIDHFGIAVEDVAATVALAREMGAQIRDEPRVGITASTIAFIEDPWGTRIELLEDPGLHGSESRPYDGERRGRRSRVVP